MDYEFGGLVKNLPESSIVQEITPEGKVCALEPPEKEDPGELNEYLHFTLKKKDYNTLDALRILKRVCRVSLKRIGFAGTKDRNCLSTQRISIWKGDFNLLSQIKLNDLEVYDFKYSAEPVTLGDLKGNRFTVPFSNFDEKMLSFIKDAGTPNFFGPQRFGSTRFANHLVGKALVLGNIEEAFKYLLGFPGKDEKDAVKKAREIADTNWGDWKKILESYPFFMRQERTLLQHLVKNPHDFVGAFMRLPKPLKKLFIHSYSSWVFNRVLERLIKEGADLKGKDIPIIGYESKLEGDIGKMVQEILAEDKVSLEDFRIKKIPTLACEGDSRPALIDMKDLEISERSVKFSLPSGSYATVLLSLIQAKNN